MLQNFKSYKLAQALYQDCKELKAQAIAALLNAPKATALADQVGACVFCLIRSLQ